TKRSVGLGLLFPNVSANNPDQMPERGGTFHLAYVLAPNFRILPRRGRPRKLATILEEMQALLPGIEKKRREGPLDEHLNGEPPSDQLVFDFLSGPRKHWS